MEEGCRCSSWRHPKGFALIKQSHRDLVLGTQEAEWVTRERACFHATGLTSALEVNKPPSSAPLPTIWGLELWYYMCLKESWEQGKNLEHWKSSGRNSEHSGESGNTRKSGRRKPGEQRELRTPGGHQRSWSIRIQDWLCWGQWGSWEPHTDDPLVHLSSFSAQVV